MGEIPVELFQGDQFKEKHYLKRAEEIALEGLDALGAGPGEPIHICRGYVLSRIRETLRGRGYRVVPSKIVGETQRMAEEAFIKSLKRMGVSGAPLEAGRRRFLTFLRWVHEDLEHRERFVKTGWPSWEKRLKRRGGRGS
ncbi:MAG: hypothetical protein ACETVR_03205 [Candidatus Bathyarchaeia archaeon]